MSNKENIIVSLLMVLFCYILALTLPNIGSVIAVTGATVNPVIGYILPIVFYMKIDPQPMLSMNKVVAKAALALVALVSFMGLIVLF